jgi:hypothetical protein
MKKVALIVLTLFVYSNTAFSDCTPQDDGGTETDQGCDNISKSVLWQLFWPDGPHGYYDSITISGTGQCGTSS